MLCYFMHAANLINSNYRDCQEDFFNVTQGSYFFSWFNGRSLTKYFTATYSALPKLNKGLIDPWVTMGFKKHLQI